MIGLTARTSTSPKAMATALRSRIQALASAHTLIQPAITGEVMTAADVTLQTLAALILEPHTRGADAVALGGPPVLLNAGAASSLALVLHELATNAAKYGALSVPAGKLSVEWSAEENAGGDAVTEPGNMGQTIRIRWAEADGPPIAEAPDRKGFGSTLIDMTVQGQMKGSLRTEWRAEGVLHELSLPMHRLR